MHPNVHSSTIYNSQKWKQPKCPLTDKWIKKLWYIYTMECYSATNKRKEWNNVICSNMDGHRDYHTKRSNSDRERQICCHLYVESKKKKKRYKLPSLQNRNRTIDIKSKLMVTKRERRCIFHCTHKLAQHWKSTITSIKELKIKKI